MSAELQFEPEGHVYRFRDIVVPSVTQVLAPLQFLQGIPWETLQAASEFGSHVHEACHLFNQGDLDEESLDVNLTPYLHQFKQFLFDTGFVVRGSEVRVYNRLMKYAGQVDFHGTWKNTTWVVDIKSGMVPSTVGAQTAAYQNAMTEIPRKRLCLQLGEHGYKMIEQKELGDMSLFTSALNVFRFNEKHNPRKNNVQ